MPDAIIIAHCVAVLLFLVAAFQLRRSAFAAFRRDMHKVHVIEEPLFFVCLDIAYNLSVYRLLGISAFMLVGAILHCVVAAKILFAVRTVRSWR